jgi:hypothetical protein
MSDITYDFEKLEIVGVMGQKVFVKSQIMSYDMFEDDELHWVCLLFNMTSWTQLQKTWIRSKKDICELYNHFCGWGMVISDSVEVGEVDIEIGDEIVIVPLLKPTDFFVDMEHG